MKLLRGDLKSQAEMSHPVRVRGLKREDAEANINHTEVAPRAGAWVETVFGRVHCFPSLWSHPVRVRGLKHKVA